MIAYPWVHLARIAAMPVIVVAEQYLAAANDVPHLKPVPDGNDG